MQHEDACIPQQALCLLITILELLITRQKTKTDVPYQVITRRFDPIQGLHLKYRAWLPVHTIKGEGHGEETWQTMNCGRECTVSGCV